MARLTYAALALALASLVSGFFIRSTAIPLFASIGLSALVLILILRGWARRLRETELGEGEELEGPAVELEELDFAEEIDAADIVVVEPEAVRPARKRRMRPSLTEVAEPDEEEYERPPPRPRPRPAHAQRTSAPRSARTAAGTTRRVVVLPGRRRYHAPGCRFARGKGAEEIAESTARRRHFQPCSVCLG